MASNRTVTVDTLIQEAEHNGYTVVGLGPGALPGGTPPDDFDEAWPTSKSRPLPWLPQAQSAWSSLVERDAGKHDVGAMHLGFDAALSAFVNATPSPGVGDRKDWSEPPPGLYTLCNDGPGEWCWEAVMVGGRMSGASKAASEAQAKAEVRDHYYRVLAHRDVQPDNEDRSEPPESADDWAALHDPVITAVSAWAAERDREDKGPGFTTAPFLAMRSAFSDYRKSVLASTGRAPREPQSHAEHDRETLARLEDRFKSVGGDLVEAIDRAIGGPQVAAMAVGSRAPRVGDAPGGKSFHIQAWGLEGIDSGRYVVEVDDAGTTWRATPPVEPATPADPVLPEGARQALVDAVVDKNIDDDATYDLLGLMKLYRRMMHEVAIRAFELGAKGASDV